MADRVSTQASLTSVLAAAIETQRGVVRAHISRGQKRLKPKSVHELRVALRRLLAALGLAQALGLGLRGRSLRRLRKLLSSLAPARDAHVQLQSLASLMPTHPGAEALLEQLKHRRRAAARRASRRLEGFQLSDFEHDVALVTGALNEPAAATASATATSAALLGQLAQRHVAVERQRPAATAGDATALHLVRLALKHYRYGLEAMGPLLPDASKATAKTCELLQNQLGRAHDAHVLATTTRELAGQQTSLQAAALTELAAELDHVSQSAHEAAALSLASAKLVWPFSDAPLM